MEKKGMKPLGISLIVLLIIAIVIVGIVAFTSHPNATGNVIGGSTPVAAPNMSNNNMMKLSDSPYADYAYLISGDQLSPETQQAISGFSINKQANSDGTTTVNLIALNPEYQNQSYTIKSGQSLYFIEKSMGDDGNGAENFLGDDHAIVVDSSGYIVQGPTTFN
jgi:hypothetical protein